MSKPGWNTQVEIDDVVIERLRIGPGEKVSVQVLIDVGHEATTGLETFHLFIERGDTTIGNVTLLVFVRQVFNVQVWVDVIGPAFVPGGPLDALVTVKNIGNGKDTFSLYGSGIDNITFIQSGLETSLLEIEQGSKATLRITATIPEEQLIGESTFIVSVMSLGDSSVRTVDNAKYMVMYPVVKVVTVMLDPSRPGPMELVTVRVVLENPGTVELVDISVNLEGGGTERIAILPPGGTATAVFTWISPDEETCLMKGSVIYGPGSNRKLWREEIVIQVDKGPVYQYWFPLIASISVVVLLFSILLSRLKKPFINNG